jgi:hypothetical protein
MPKKKETIEDILDRIEEDLMTLREKVEEEMENQEDHDDDDSYDDEDEE